MSDTFARARAALHAAMHRTTTTHAHAATAEQIADIQQRIGDSNATDAQLDALADRLTRDLLVDGQQLIRDPAYMHTVTISGEVAALIDEALRTLG